jgi:hypothetical protein
MTEFTKTKIHFALALLGTLFALHPFLDRFEDAGFLYLGYPIKWFYAYLATAGCLAICVYCFGLTLVSEKPHSWLEHVGNDFYILAVTIGPLFSGLYVASLLAEQLKVSHLAWAAPAVAVGVGVGWLVLSQAIALLLRRRLNKQDRSAKVGQLANQEVTSLNHARELFAGGYIDSSVMETWRAVEARLRRVLLARGIAPRQGHPDAVIAAAKRAGVLKATTLASLDQLKQAWATAVSSEPITEEAASTALAKGQEILASIAVDDGARAPLAA